MVIRDHWGAMREKDPEDATRLTLASERSEAEIAAERQRQDAERVAEALNDAARELAANLLRIIAGAGKSHTLISEIVALLNAYRELQPYAGTAAYSSIPTAPITDGLTDLDWRKNNPAYPDYRSEESLRRWLKDETEEVRLAEEEVVRAALRLAAARLARQPTQESASRHQFTRAFVELRRAQTKRGRLQASSRPSGTR